LNSRFYYAEGVELEPYQAPFYGIDSESLHEFIQLNNPDELEKNGWKMLPNGEYPFHADSALVNDTVKLSYRINKHGFRGVEMPEASAPRSILALGSNMTFGMAMPEALSWPTLVGSKVGYRAISLAKTNTSLESQYRLLLAWLPQLRSEWVVLQEQHDQANQWERVERNKFVDEALPGGSELSVVRRDLVLRSMQHLCDQFKVKFIHIPPEVELTDAPDFGRDLMSPGRTCHRYLACQAMKEMGGMD